MHRGAGADGVTSGDRFLGNNAARYVMGGGGAGGNAAPQLHSLSGYSSLHHHPSYQSNMLHHQQQHHHHQQHLMRGCHPPPRGGSTSNNNSHGIEPMLIGGDEAGGGGIHHHHLSPQQPNSLSALLAPTQPPPLKQSRQQNLSSDAAVVKGSARGAIPMDEYGGGGMAVDNPAGPPSSIGPSHPPCVSLREVRVVGFSFVMFSICLKPAEFMMTPLSFPLYERGRPRPHTRCLIRRYGGLGFSVRFVRLIQFGRCVCMIVDS